VSLCQSGIKQPARFLSAPGTDTNDTKTETTGETVETVAEVPNAPEAPINTSY